MEPNKILKELKKWLEEKIEYTEKVERKAAGMGAYKNAIKMMSYRDMCYELFNKIEELEDGK